MINRMAEHPNNDDFNEAQYFVKSLIDNLPNDFSVKMPEKFISEDETLITDSDDYYLAVCKSFYLAF